MLYSGTKALKIPLYNMKPSKEITTYTIGQQTLQITIWFIAATESNSIEKVRQVTQFTFIEQFWGTFGSDTKCFEMEKRELLMCAHCADAF